MATFDKTRDYGEIFGDAEGRRYMQDGAFFDVNGKQVGVANDAPKAARGKRAPAVEQPAEPTPTSQVDAQLTAEFE